MPAASVCGPLSAPCLWREGRRPVSPCPWRPLPEPTAVSRSQPPVPQEELENFPLPSVRHSQTVLNQLRYPSVLLLVCQDSDQSKPDVHFFHCDEVEVRRGRGLGGTRPSSEPA